MAEKTGSHKPGDDLFSIFDETVVSVFVMAEVDADVSTDVVVEGCLDVSGLSTWWTEV